MFRHEEKSYVFSRLCVNIFNYKVNPDIILDAFKMNNLKSIEIALKLNMVSIDNIYFEDSYIYELFSYGCTKSIEWGINHRKIQSESLINIFKTYDYIWKTESTTSLYNTSFKTLKLIDLDSYNRLLDNIQD